MISTLQTQYALAQRSRGVMLDFIETNLNNHLYTPVPAYENRTIGSLLQHNLLCYLGWLVYFDRPQLPELINNLDFTSMAAIRTQYARLDDIAGDFLTRFEGKMDTPIMGEHNRNGRLSATPLQLFTHVLTHEFHHKGQILSMCRLLGHVPPDTDISLFFEYENSTR